MSKGCSALLLSMGMAITGASASAKDLTTADLNDLMRSGKTFQLGGEGMGYSGTLTVSSNGSAKGSAKTDGGKEIVINGKWRIQDNRFCRTWKSLDQGKEICERWDLVAPNRVEVYNGDKVIGVNSW